MHSIESLPREKVRAVFSDIDDTLTENSLLSSATLKALEDLKAKGLWTVLVSGRPAGWADCIARIFPIDAIIFENGAGVMIKNGEKIETVKLAAESGKKILENVFQDLKKEIPHLKLATDQPYRLTDYAIDFNEEPPKLNSKELERVLSRLASEKEITAKLSSIHVNYWHGTHTKVTACQYLLERVGKARGINSSEVVYVGDSPNDEPLFDYFALSVGVANVNQFLSKMKNHPKYICKKNSGLGFQELVSFLLFR